MAHIVENRILETTTTTGTGAIALAAAVTGFRRFNAKYAVGDTTPYFIEAIDSTGQPSGDFEYGIGTYSAANTLARTTVLGSSNADALVNFAAGSKNVGVAALGDGLIPAGAVMDFLATLAPSGFTELDGGVLSRAQYPALFAHASTSGNMAATDAAWTKGQWSPGDGATTFRKPDMRGYHRRSWDHGAGVDAGRGIGSTQADQMPLHAHAASVTVNESPHHHDWGHNNQNGAGAGGGNYGGTSGGYAEATSAVTTGVTVGVSIGNAGAGLETRVKTIAVLTCVKT
jgi:microcystin-dependent protein